ncbi:MAG: hypothetical protein Q7S23_00930 [bacterium]|nr:hypothetical protein [bacterium]
MKLVRIFTLAAAVLAVGCARGSGVVDTAMGVGAARAKLERVDPQMAAIQCQQLCRQQVTLGADLAAGPCLGNPIPGLENWVCDVAHLPRQAVDNDPANQCAAFRSGSAKHFVEVGQDCNVIKTR